MISPHLFKHLPALAGAVVLALSTGCGSGARCTLEGKVSYAGEPVDQGGVVFIPVPEESHPRMSAPIIGGRYKLASQAGPEPGKHRIEITWRKKTGQKTPGEGGHPKDEIVQGIPTKYNAESELFVEVKPGHNTFDFILKE